MAIFSASGYCINFLTVLAYMHFHGLAMPLLVRKTENSGVEMTE
jgi:hypothetical protein